MLLDVHHSRIAAERLRATDLDVVAAADDPELETLSDDELLRYAASVTRAVVTENAKDFDRIVRGWAATGEHHCGVVFTSPRRFHRGAMAYPENLVGALSRFMKTPPATPLDWVHWLE
jgi:hypothetical protein